MIKLVAVDMDGTFLSSHKTYDRQRFLQIYQALNARGIKFVVASGNQYAQLRSFFPEMQDDIAYVAENGMLVYDQGRLIHEEHFTQETVLAVVDYLRQHYPTAEWTINGIRSAYIENQATQAFKDSMTYYCHALTYVDDFAQLDFEQEQYIKFALAVPTEETWAIAEALEAQFPGQISSVSSGHGNIDLIVPNNHKANGLKILSERWQIAPEDMMAFGDGQNDLAMLQYVGHSYAMANGPEMVQAVAKYQAPHHDESGVLQVLEAYLQQ